MDSGAVTNVVALLERNRSVGRTDCRTHERLRLTSSKLWRGPSRLIGDRFGVIASLRQATRRSPRSPAGPRGLIGQQLLNERETLSQRVASLRREGKLEEAVAAAQQVVVLTRRAFGVGHPQVGGALKQLAAVYRKKRKTGRPRRRRGKRWSSWGLSSTASRIIA